MIRLSKFADYGIVLLTYIANRSSNQPTSARHLSEQSHLPLPTVGKILKTLSRAGILVSHRGPRGGYMLARSSHAITVAEVIAAIDGPIALTECSSHAPSLCEFEPSCPVRSNWRHISRAVVGALEELTLADMTRPVPQPNPISGERLIQLAPSRRSS